MGRDSSILLCRQYLFEDADTFRDKVPAADYQKIIRCRAMYLWFIETPHAKDAAFVAEDCARHKISRPTAYSDLAVIKSILPDLSRTAKEFHLWRYNEMILETYATAKKKGDTRTMQKAASDYAKYNRIDTDREDIDLSETAPQPFIPTVDPTVLGIQPIPDLEARKKALIEKYSRESSDIADIDFEEIDLNAATAAPDPVP